MTKGRPIISLLLITILVHITTVHAADLASTDDGGSRQEDDSMSFELIHRHALEVNGATQKAPFEKFKELLAKDLARRQSRLRRLLVTDDMGLPLTSAADLGMAEYVVDIKVGTPPQSFYLVADTGSSLSWIKCKINEKNMTALLPEDLVFENSSDAPGGRVFDADRSSTFKTFGCSSKMCMEDLSELFSLTRCPVPEDPCLFDHGYIGGEFTYGLFAKETVSIGLRGTQKNLKDIVIGCSLRHKGVEGADGVLGLGYDKYSFAMQAATGAKFSYCLVDHLSPQNVSAYLLFGNNKELMKKKAETQVTELVDADHAYGVHVKGISVGGKMLDIPPSTWDFKAGGGAIVDSGTSTTFLTTQAYGAVIDSLKEHLSAKYQAIELPPEAPNMEFCFNATTTPFDVSVVPKLAIHFRDGAVYHPDVNGYVVDMGGPLLGVRCLGFVPVEGPSHCIIGNILQQNHIWEYDRAHHKLAFAPSTSCNY